jgi:hypothetical protein
MDREKRSLAWKIGMLLTAQIVLNILYLFWVFKRPFRSLPAGFENVIFLLFGATFCITGIAVTQWLAKQPILGGILGIAAHLVFFHRVVLSDSYGFEEFNFVFFVCSILITTSVSGVAIGWWFLKRPILGGILFLISFLCILYLYGLLPD